MDTESFEASWRQHAAGLRQLVRDLLGDAHAADDVAQETWLTALSRPPREGWSLRAWLGGIARHRARDFARAEGRRRRHEERAPVRADAEQTAAIERFEEIELVVEALRQLSPRNREIVLLRYYEDLAPTAIAERLALPIATVKSRLRRSLAELRRRLEGRAFPAWIWLGGATVTLKSKSGIAMLAAALLLLTGIVWIAILGLDPDSATEQRSKAVDEIASASSSPGNPPSSTSRAEAPQQADASVSNAVAAEEGVLLQVVSRSEGLPIAGAQVMYVDSGRSSYDPIAVERENYEPQDPEILYAEVAERLETDARGEAVLPRSIPRAWIGARHGELWGWTFLSTLSPNPLRLELEPETSLRIRVLDESGAPCTGVSVGLRMYSPRELVDCFVTGATNAPDGVCVLRHVERWSNLWRRDRKFGASFAFPMNEPPFLELDPRAAAFPEVELRLPPTGSVLFRVLDAEGMPLAAESFVGLSSRSVSRTNPGWVKTFQWLPVERSEARFPHVGLGLNLTAYLIQLGNTYQPVELRLDGPTREGEETHATLQLAQRVSALGGTLVDENGAPLQDLRLNAYRIRGSASPSSGDASHIRIGSDGRFRYVLEEEPHASQDRLELVSMMRSDGSDPRRMWSGTLDLAGRSFPPGEHELGEVALSSSPPLVSGVIVGDGGQAMAAELVVESYADRYGRLEWNRVSFPPEALVQRSGEFSIYGRCDSGDLRLSAHRDGYLSMEPVPFTRGQADLRLELCATAAIEGQVLLDAGVAPRSLHVRIEGPAVPKVVYREPLLLDATGKFRIDDLHDGRATLRICAAPEDATPPPASADFFRIEDLELRTGETCADERLREIDLRGRAHTLRLSVADASGAPIAGVQFSHRGSDRPQEPWRRSTTASDGSGTIIARSLPQELHVGKQGYSMFVLPAVDRDLHATLEPAITCTFELDEDWLVAREQAQLVLSVTGTEQRSFPGNTPPEEIMRLLDTQRRTLGVPNPLSIGSDTRYELLLPGPGEYLVNLELESGGPGEWRCVITQRRFRVDGPQTLRLEFSAELLQRALKGLQRSREHNK